MIYPVLLALFSLTLNIYSCDVLCEVSYDSIEPPLTKNLTGCRYTVYGGLYGNAKIFADRLHANGATVTVTTMDLKKHKDVIKTVPYKVVEHDAARKSIKEFVNEFVNNFYVNYVREDAYVRLTYVTHPAIDFTSEELQIASRMYITDPIEAMRQILTRNPSNVQLNITLGATQFFSGTLSSLYSKFKVCKVTELNPESKSNKNSNDKSFE